MCKSRVRVSSLWKGWGWGIKYFSAVLVWVVWEKSPGSPRGEWEVRGKEANNEGIIRGVTVATCSSIPLDVAGTKDQTRASEVRDERAGTFIHQFPLVTGWGLRPGLLSLHTFARFWFGPQAELPVGREQVKQVNWHQMVIGDRI